MNDSWLEIACDVPAEVADVVAEYLTVLSGNGVCMENLSVDAFSASEIPDSQRMTVKAYLPADLDPTPQMAELEAYLLELAGRKAGLVLSAPTITAVRSEDWSTSWKVHFKPLRVGARLLIVPT